MVERVVLHIGTMKSGTTYLQRVLDTGVVESVGCFYAGGSFQAQSKAVDSVAGPRAGGRSRAWHALAQRVRRRDGVAVYSHEFLSFASEDTVAEVVASFHGAPVDVVLTVRDQLTAIPAQWQTFVRNRGTDAWHDYVRSLETIRGRARRRSQRGYAIRSFRRAQDVPAIISRWHGRPGVASVTVVLVPPAGAPPELLWQRFCEAVRIDVPAPPQAGPRLNQSLGYASCEALRRLNPTLTDLSRVEHERVRRAVMPALLPLRSREGRPLLDQRGAALACRLNSRILRAVDAAGVRLVGRHDDLPLTSAGDGPSSISPPDPGELHRALEALWSGSVPGVPAPSDDPDELVPELGRRLAARFGP